MTDNHGPISYDKVSGLIARNYQLAGFTGVSIGVGTKIGKEFPGDITKSKFQGIFAFIDELIYLYSQLNVYLLGCGINKDGTPKFHLDFAEMAHSSLTAIRLLASSGLDSACRVQMRSLLEHQLLWLRLQRDERLQEEYTKSEKSVDGANTWWKKNISGGKSIIELEKIFQAPDSHWLGKGPEWSPREVFKKLSISVHPSAISLSMNVESKWQYVSDNFAVGSAVQTSHFVLAHTVFLGLLPFVHTFFKPLGTAGIDVRSSLPPEIGTRHFDWDENNHKLQQVLASLFISFVASEPRIRERAQA